MEKRLLNLFLAVISSVTFYNFAFCAEPNFVVSDQSLNFGHDGTQKSIYLTNTNPNSDLMWNAQVNVPWLKLEQVQGQIDNPSRIPANAAYTYSNMWPKLPQPWYFKNIWSVGTDHKGNVYAVDSERGRVIKFNKYGEFCFELGSDDHYVGETDKDNGYYLGKPLHVAFDSEDNLYVSGGMGVKKFSNSGDFLFRLEAPSDTGKYFLSGTGDIAVNSKDCVYVIVESSVFKFDAQGNYQKQWGGVGLGNGQFLPSYDRGMGIVIDSKDNIYVADNHFGRIQKFDSEEHYKQKWAFVQDKSVTLDPLTTINTDWQLGGQFAIDKNDIIYVGHEHSRFLYKFTTEGEWIPFVWSFRDAQGNPTGFNFAGDVAIDKDGTIYAGYYYEVARISSDGTINLWVSSDFHPKDMTVDHQGRVFVIDELSGGNSLPRVQVFDSLGKLVAKWDFKDKPYQNELSWSPDSDPIRMAADLNGNIYIGQYNRILKFDGQGNFLIEWKIPDIKSLSGIAVDSKLNVYVSNYQFSPFPQLVKLDQQGNVIWECVFKTIIGDWGYRTVLPLGVAVDSRDNVYVVDTFGTKEGTVYQVTLQGDLVPKAEFISRNGFSGQGSGMSQQMDIAFDAKDNLYVLFAPGKEIQKFDLNGNFLSTFGLWNKGEGGSGEGEFIDPLDIDVGPQGNLYVSDYGNNRVQVFSQAVQTVKATLDRTKLYSTTNIGKITFSNSRNAAETVSVDVTALTDTPVNSPPTTDALTPNSGSFETNQPLVITAKYSDINGVGDIDFVWLTFKDPAFYLKLMYDRVNNELSIFDDSGLGRLGTAPGTGSPIGNKYVTLDCVKTKVYSEGDNTLVLEWALTFKDAFAGAKNIYSSVIDRQSQYSGENLKGAFTIILKDVLPPEVSITSPITGQPLSLNGFTFSGTATDTSGIAEVRVLIYDYGRKSWTVNNALAGYNPQDSRWSYTVSKDAITPGNYCLLLARAKDNKGNISVWQKIYAVIEQVDITPPVVVISSPINLAAVPSSGFLFQGIAFDTSGVAEVRTFVYDYGRQKLTAFYALASYNPQNNQWMFTLSPEMITPDKYCVLYVRAKDTVGNWSACQRITVKVQNDPDFLPSYLRRLLNIFKG